MNFTHKKKLAVLLCTLAFTLLLFSVTQANRGQMSVLLYAPNSTNITTHLQETIATHNSQIDLIPVDSWESVQNLLDDTTTLIVDETVLAEIDPADLQATFINNPLTVIGFNVDDGQLADSLGVYHLYDALYHREVERDEALPYYYAYYFDSSGEGHDIQTYLNAPSLEQSTIGIENPLQLHTIARTDSLSTVEEYTKLVEMIVEMAEIDSLESEPTAVTLTQFSSYKHPIALTIGLLMVSIVALLFVSRRHGWRTYNLILPLLILGGGVISSASVYASSSKLETVHYYTDAQTSLHEGDERVVEAVTQYWSDQVATPVLSPSEAMVTRTMIQRVDGTDAEITTAYDALIDYCVRPTGFYFGCNENTLAKDVKKRFQLGFSTDIEYIKAVYSSDEVAFDPMAGEIALSPEELAEYSIRIAMQDDIPLIRQQFDSSPDLFGGIYIDHPEGSEDVSVQGKVVVQFVESYRDQGIQLLEELKSSLTHPERIEVEFVSFSQATIEQKYESLHFMEDPEGILLSIGIATAGNRVQVGITPEFFANTVQSRSRTHLIQNLPEVYHPLADATVELIEIDPDVGKVTPTARGGQHLGAGTSGFVIIYDGEKAILTAGHLTGGSGVEVSNAKGNPIGVMSDKRALGSSNRDSGTGVDAGIIDLYDPDDTSASITFWNPKGTTTRSRSVKGTSGSFTEGETICTTGRTTKTQCGEIYRVSVTYALGANWVRNALKVDMDIDGGDSGGPVFKYSYKTREVYASAIINGSDALGYSYHSKLSQIDDLWSFSVPTQ